MSLHARNLSSRRAGAGLFRRGSSLTAGLLAVLIASTAQGSGVGFVTTAKTIPEATIAVIDPESGTSSGGGSTDVNVGVGDIILFQFRFMPVPESQLNGLNAWLTEYVPPNLQVVGVRLMDEDGVTITPNLPGMAQNGTAVAANGWGGITCTGGTCPVQDGGLSQLYGDTGVFYSTDARTARNPSNALITLGNGLIYPDPARIGGDANLRAALGVSSPFRAHNAWDWAQVGVFGANGGNTPHLYGSPVAGPNTHYRYEATNNGGSLQFNSVVGPWQRVRYPGSQIATGGAAVDREGAGMGRTIANASATGWDLTPNNPLPHVADGDPASANAVRVAVGEVRAGRPVYAEIAFRVMGTPLDPGFGAMGADMNCGESFGGDISGSPTSDDGENNMWGFFVPSPACVFLNLLFDISADEVIRNNSDAYDDVQFTIRTRNLSTLPRTNVWVRQKYNGRVTLDPLTPYPDLAPTCTVLNCDGDGFNCLYWGLGTLDPSEEILIRTNFDVNNGGDPITPMRADFTSDDLGTRSGDPCAVGGAISAPGFRTQESVQIRSLGAIDADLVSDTPSASPGGNAALSGAISVDGTQSLTVRELWLGLPAGWTGVDSGGSAGPDVVFGGVRRECGASCATNTPKFTGIGLAMTQGTSQGLSFSVRVPPGTPAGLYPVDLQVFVSQSGYGGTKENYFNDIAFVSVGRPRSEVPTLDCPVLSSWTTIPGDTTEADGTTVRVYFNGIVRGSTPLSSGNRFAVGGWAGPADTFGPLYGGLEVRATAQAPGENESELSVPCYVTQVSACQDGVDNDGDGLIDFPADPGCSGPTDGDEGDPECSDGVDNDGDLDVDWPDDLECDGPDDEDEGGLPACQDGVDNDGDGATDFPADPDCTSATDRTEATLRRCMNGQDDDGDGLFDFPDDPGCHSANDDDELDFAYLPDDIRARLLLVFDTSGSMNWNTCADDFTGGDGSVSCAGADVSCAECGNTGCGNGIADDSRIFQARQGLTDVVAGFGEVEYGLMRFAQRPRAFNCPGVNASDGSGGWQGAGAAPCGGGFSGGDLLVGFSPENEYDLLEWMDGETNYPGAPPPGLDFELRGSGTTPIAGSLDDARAYLASVQAGDVAEMCRPYRVILITDGQETCAGDPVASADALRLAGFTTYVIGFATGDPGVRANLDAIALAGGSSNAIFADDATTLSASISDIVNDSILIETCNGVDDDCDILVDEGFTLFCDRPNMIATPTECVDPGETVCDGVDDNCDGRIDEGLRNACGTCGVVPTETCNGIDDDCDGPIDEGGVCSGCVIEAEVCDGIDNDCDGPVDEGLSRGCGTDVGVCAAGTEVCGLGTWGACSGTGPTVETCNGLDDDCDGVIDGNTRPCGVGTGACEPGTETCSMGAWSGSCIGAVGSTTELCNLIDDDCDGPIDEGNPSGGGACGSSIGACRPGTLTCSMGGLVCTGQTGPVVETCNAVDDDCDGRIDEEIATGAACGTCGEGVLTCVAGGFECRGDRVPGTETCNTLDDDCDGSVDEGDPGGGATCGSSIGVCTTGLTECVAGSISCVGGTGGSSEICNTLDDDCDNIVDEGNPEGGAACGASDVGECELGRLACTSGTLLCVGETVSSAERCDGLDNDCDGSIDEADPGGGAACGDDTGECSMGTLRCLGGTLTCDGSIGPTEEVCDALDNDCDGVVDDGLDVGAPCGTDVGECVPGLLTCIGGEVLCDGAIGAMPESCNALDDDCDAIVDEELALGAVCGDTEGACMPGMLQCVSGREVCTGEVPSGVEACDCDDNDCDGAIDEEPETGSLCPGESVCLDCSCALPCADSEFGRCPAGRVPVEDEMGCFCVAPRCNPETCGSETVVIDEETRCAPDDPNLPACECRMNACTFPCDGVVCADPTVCNPFDGRCVEDNCRGLGCPAGELCRVVSLECVPDPCETAGCAADEVCRDGACEQSCATVSCDAGDICRMGACVEDLCAAGCAAGEACDPSDGSCVADMCGGVSCPAGAVCNPLTGLCATNPCTFVRCPEGQLCVAGGECALDTPPEEDAGVPTDGGAELDASAFDAGMVVEDPEDRVLASGGCQCRAGERRSDDPGGPLVGLLVLGMLAWRRRRVS